MRAAGGFGETGWLSWLSWGDKRRQSAISSSGAARTGYGVVASKILGEASERTTTQDRVGVAPATTRPLEVEVGQTEPGMASDHAHSLSLSSESIVAGLSVRASDGEPSYAANSLEPPAFAFVAETAATAADEPGPAPIVAGSEPRRTADSDGEPRPSEPDSAPLPLIGDQLEPANPADARAALVAELGEDADYTLVFTPDSIPFSAGKGMEHALITDGSGITALRIAKGEENANSTGSTGGYSVRVPDEFEKLASGRAIKLRLLARSVDAAKGRIACAYSTNEVGNSGWRWLSFGPEWEIKSFEFNVPPMQEGRGDFVGLLPPSSSAPETEILGFAIQVAP